jgi:hypothetical protein
MLLILILLLLLVLWQRYRSSVSALLPLRVLDHTTRLPIASRTPNIRVSIIIANNTKDSPPLPTSLPKQYELVLLDYSTTTTTCIPSSYITRHIKLDRHTDIATAINIALRLASGKYIVINPSDYQSIPQLVQQLDQHQHALLLLPTLQYDHSQHKLLDSIAPYSTKLNALLNTIKTCHIDSTSRIMTHKTAKLLTLPAVCSTLPKGNDYFRAMVYFIHIAHPFVHVGPMKMQSKRKLVQKDTTSVLNTLNTFCRVYIACRPHLRNAIFDLLSIGLNINRKPMTI